MSQIFLSCEANLHEKASSSFCLHRQSVKTTSKVKFFLAENGDEPEPLKAVKASQYASVSSMEGKVNRSLKALMGN